MSYSIKQFLISNIKCSFHFYNYPIKIKLISGSKGLNKLISSNSKLVMFYSVNSISLKSIDFSLIMEPLTSHVLLINSASILKGILSMIPNVLLAVMVFNLILKLLNVNYNLIVKTTKYGMVLNVNVN